MRVFPPIGVEMESDVAGDACRTNTAARFARGNSENLACFGMLGRGMKMAGNPENEKQQQISSKKSQSREEQQKDVSLPAIRHIGPTLESDPKYLEMADTGAQTPETLIEQGIGTDDSNVRDIVSRGTDLERPLGQDRGLTPDEPLKTRLPGDTSSDPH